MRFPVCHQRMPSNSKFKNRQYRLLSSSFNGIMAAHVRESNPLSRLRRVYDHVLHELGMRMWEHAGFDPLLPLNAGARCVLMFRLSFPVTCRTQGIPTPASTLADGVLPSGPLFGTTFTVLQFRPLSLPVQVSEALPGNGRQFLCGICSSSW